jgi:hypothetical protein
MEIEEEIKLNQTMKELGVYLLHKFFKQRIGNPSNTSLEAFLKLGGVVAVSNMSLDYLFQQGIIPRNIMKM